MRLHLGTPLLACAFATAAGAQEPVLRPGSAQLSADSIAERVRVEGAEDVALAGGGRVPAWRVLLDDDGRGGPATYWMDRESRTLVQVERGQGTLRIVRSRPPRSGAP